MRTSMSPARRPGRRLCRSINVKGEPVLESRPDQQGLSAASVQRTSAQLMLCVARYTREPQLNQLSEHPRSGDVEREAYESVRDHGRIEPGAPVDPSGRAAADCREDECPSHDERRQWQEGRCAGEVGHAESERAETN